ncbi:hypothetical protein OG350_31695 [Streptomyces achromogenes]|uniref:Uncharacterized protein n=1 Tax=Streptomyces achromogenes TaxID=67255 RepID=A0ABZ1KWU8_STRAH
MADSLPGKDRASARFLLVTMAAGVSDLADGLSKAAPEVAARRAAAASGNAVSPTNTAVGSTQEFAFSVTAKADGVWPGTTWPTRTDITASGFEEAVSGSRITLKVVKDDPFGGVP